MRRIVGAFVLGTLLAGCAQAASAPNSSSPTSPPTSPTLPSDTAILLARPLKLPAVPSGSTCPVTPIAGRKLGVSDPRGSGPFYLGGPMPRGAFAWNKTVWVLVDGASGPVLFRGSRVDGAGSLQFSGSPAEPSDKGLTPSSGGGASATFYDRVIDQGAGDALLRLPGDDRLLRIAGGWALV